jgi:hypothetical protein
MYHQQLFLASSESLHETNPPLIAQALVLPLVLLVMLLVRLVRYRLHRT